MVEMTGRKERRTRGEAHGGKRIHRGLGTRVTRRHVFGKRYTDGVEVKKKR
jgi:hypothetical protein